MHTAGLEFVFQVEPVTLCKDKCDVGSVLLALSIEQHNLYHLMNNIYKSLEQYFPSLWVLSTQKWKLSLTLHSWLPSCSWCSTLQPTLPLLLPSQSKDRILPCALQIKQVHSSLWIIHILWFCALDGIGDWHLNSVGSVDSYEQGPGEYEQGLGEVGAGEIGGRRDIMDWILGIQIWHMIHFWVLTCATCKISDCSLYFSCT